MQRARALVSLYLRTYKFCLDEGEEPNRGAVIQQADPVLAVETPDACELRRMSI